MKMRSLVSAAVAVCVLFSLIAPAGTASAKGKKKAGPVVVGKDEIDWGANVDPNIGPIGNQLGQELVEASITMADKKTVNFIITVNSLPPWGGIPESSRYNWDINVDGTAFQLTGAFTEYLRGICNPLHTNSCPPPQDPGMQPFFVRQGPCLVGEECHVLAIVHATFAPADGTITIPVPLSLIKGKPGSKIAPGVSSLGGTVYAAPAAIVSQASLPNDTMVVTGTYTVPKK